MNKMGVQKARDYSVNQQMREWLDLNNAIDDVAGQIPCRQAPDLFFPEGGTGTAAMDAKMAKKACQSCPVLTMCATYAIRHREEDGIWGGMSYNDRKEIWSKNA
jgi:WhiB family redox-sensing transcriptional regulator